MRYMAAKRVTFLVGGKPVTIEAGKLLDMDSIDADNLSEMLERRLLIQLPDGELPSRDEYKTPEEIRKIKKKEDLIAYGHSIGLTELNETMKVDEIRAAIIDFVAQMEDESDTDDGSFSGMEE